jgi:hypothetical protein
MTEYCSKMIEFTVVKLDDSHKMTDHCLKRGVDEHYSNEEWLSTVSIEKWLGIIAKMVELTMVKMTEFTVEKNNW